MNIIMFLTMNIIMNMGMNEPILLNSFIIFS